MSHDLTPVQTEAVRQIEICNACRYCEGYCSVFPAMFAERAFSAADVTQLANLCHNCRGCYYACQYTAPHEFDLNLPAILAEARLESWERFAWPAASARLFQQSGVAVALALVAGIAMLFWAISAAGTAGGTGFYAYLRHAAMVAIFAPAFLLPLAAIGMGLRTFWLEIGGSRPRWSDIVDAGKLAGRMKNLDGGHGDGCNFERGDRYSNARRHAHQAVLWGFLLCFASTASGTVLHYLFAIEAPYPLWSLPKLFGVPGGLLLTVGAAALARLKLKADRELGARRAWGGEMGFVLLLGLTGFSGLALYAATGSGAVPALLALHLGAVLALFLTMPYSKMAHGFYRFAALMRDAQIRRGG